MFALLVQTNKLSEYLGSVGVEGGQGDADNLFGSHDDHGQLGVASGAGDIDDKYFSTGNIYVSHVGIWRPPLRARLAANADLANLV
jgi:hypothetical protein